MSRQSSCQYLLLYLVASTILVRGSLQRILKRSCPSCSQDCPEALTVQLPWDTREEASLQSNERSLPINSLKNPFYSASTQDEIFENAARNKNIRSSQYPPSYGDRRSFLRREPASKDLSFGHLNTFPKYLNKRNFLSPASGYPRVPSTRQFLDPARNTFLKNFRSKFSEPVQDRRPEIPIFYALDRRTPASEVPVSYRVDRNIVPSWNNLRGALNILPQNFYPRDTNAFRYRREDEGRKKSTSPASHDSLQPPVIYNPIRFSPPEVKRDNYIFPPKDLNILRAPMRDVLLRNWDIIKDSVELKLAQQKLNSAKTNLSEMYPEKEDKTIVSNVDNEQINYNPYALPLDLHTSNPSKNEESFDWKLTARKNSQGSTEVERSEANENNWPPMYPTIGQNIRYFEDERDEKGEHFVDEDEFYRQLFEDENKNGTVSIERGYGPYIHHMSNWGRVTDEDLFDAPDFLSLDSQEARNLEIYPEENNSELLRDNEDVILKDEAYADRIIRPPVINANNAYVIPGALHTLNNAKYPVKSLEIQEASENKDDILHGNVVGKKGNEIYEDKTIMQNDMRGEGSIFSKNNLNTEKYPVIDTQNIKSNAQDEIFTRLDPDLLDDVENPPTESVESLLESSDFSMSRQQ